jgi:hypothetical protein
VHSLLMPTSLLGLAGTNDCAKYSGSSATIQAIFIAYLYHSPTFKRQKAGTYFRKCQTATSSPEKTGVLPFGVERFLYASRLRERKKWIEQSPFVKAGLATEPIFEGITTKLRRIYLHWDDDYQVAYSAYLLARAYSEKDSQKNIYQGSHGSRFSGKLFHD